MKMKQNMQEIKVRADDVHEVNKWWRELPEEKRLVVRWIGSVVAELNKGEMCMVLRQRGKREDWMVVMRDVPEEKRNGKKVKEGV